MRTSIFSCLAINFLKQCIKIQPTKNTKKRIRLNYFHSLYDNYYRLKHLVPFLLKLISNDFKAILQCNFQVKIIKRYIKYISAYLLQARFPENIPFFHDIPQNLWVSLIYCNFVAPQCSMQNIRSSEYYVHCTSWKILVSFTRTRTPSTLR